MYTLRIFQFAATVAATHPTPTVEYHTHVATYEDLATMPWVPPIGSYFRFRDASVEEREIAGRVAEVVTLFYGSRTTIEIYLRGLATP